MVTTQICYCGWGSWRGVSGRVKLIDEASLILIPISFSLVNKRTSVSAISVSIFNGLASRSIRLEPFILVLPLLEGFSKHWHRLGVDSALGGLNVGSEANGFGQIWGGIFIELIGKQSVQVGVKPIWVHDLGECLLSYQFTQRVLQLILLKYTFLHVNDHQHCDAKHEK